MLNGKRVQLRYTKDEAKLSAVRGLKSIEFDAAGHPAQIWTHRQDAPYILERGVRTVRGYLSDVHHSSGNVLNMDLAGAPYIEGRARLPSTIYVNDTGLVGLFTFKLKIGRSISNDFRNVRFAEAISFADRSEWDEHKRAYWGKDIPPDASFVSLATDFTFDMWEGRADLPCEMFDRLHDAVRSAGQTADIQLSLAVDCYATAAERIIPLPWHGVMNLIGIYVVSVGTIAPFSARPDADYMTTW